MATGEQQKEYNKNLNAAFPPGDNNNGDDAVTRTVLWVGGGDDLKPLTNPVDESAAHFEQLAINMFAADSGIQASRLGAAEHPTYNNSKVFEERFLRNTIAPLCRQIGDAIQSQLDSVTHLNGVKSLEIVQNDIVHYDIEREDAAQEVQRKRADTLVKATAAVRNLMAAGLSYDEAIRALPGAAEIMGQSIEPAPTAAEMIRQAYDDKRTAEAEARSREWDRKWREQKRAEAEQQEAEEAERQRLMRQAITDGRANDMDEAATIVATDMIIGIMDKALFPEGHQNGATPAGTDARRGA